MTQTFAPALRAPLTSLLKRWGCTVDCRRVVTGSAAPRSPDNTPLGTSANVVGGATTRALISDVSAGKAIYDYGDGSLVTAKAVIVLDAIGEPALSDGDGLIVLDGPRLGQVFEIVDVNPVDLAGVAILALKVTDKRFL